MGAAAAAAACLLAAPAGWWWAMMMDGWMRPVSVRSEQSGSVLVPRPWVGASVCLPSLLRARVDSRPTHFNSST